MRTIRIKLFKFDELSPEAKKKAIAELSDVNVDYEWWEFTYEDAALIGLKITGFDIDRSNDITGDFTKDAEEVANLIVANHGEDCDTYKLATTFDTEKAKIIDAAPRDEAGEFEDEREVDSNIDELEKEFKRALLEEYLSMLRNEYEYQTSDEAIISSIKANEYEFTKDGQLH